MSLGPLLIVTHQLHTRFNCPVTELHKVYSAVLREVAGRPRCLRIFHVNAPFGHLPLGLNELLVANLTVLARVEMFKCDLVLVEFTNVLQQKTEFGLGHHFVVNFSCAFYLGAGDVEGPVDH